MTECDPIRWNWINILISICLRLLSTWYPAFSWQIRGNFLLSHMTNECLIRVNCIVLTHVSQRTSGVCFIFHSRISVINIVFRHHWMRSTVKCACKLQHWGIVNILFFSWFQLNSIKEIIDFKYSGQSMLLLISKYILPVEKPSFFNQLTS